MDEEENNCDNFKCVFTARAHRCRCRFVCCLVWGFEIVCNYFLVSLGE